MKTNLNRAITNEYDAVEFLYELWENGEEYHPEDDALDIVWNGIPHAERPTEDECKQLNSLMESIYFNTDIDPCAILVLLTNRGHRGQELVKKMIYK